jgi:hypothetical protein
MLINFFQFRFLIQNAVAEVDVVKSGKTTLDGRVYFDR